MEILSVSLKNFKSHSDRSFEFRPGTNAICGENGAGKTSILEAIAWALFDHTDYQKTELIRTGAASAQVAVTFISNQDGRTYVVRRCTSKGYDLYDPQLKLNLGLKRLEDVNRWLCEHLGVPPQTELAKLFADTIGIPQGTFTVDFLKSKNDRKRVFDPILKVEAYKQTFDQTRDLETYAKNQVEKVEQAIAQYDQRLQDWEDLKATHLGLKREIHHDEDRVKFLTKQLATLQAEQEQLTTQFKQQQQLSQQLQQLATQIKAKGEAQQLLEQTLAQAQQAVEICQVQHQGYLAYQQAAAALQELDQQRQQQQRLFHQRQVQQQHLSDRQRELTQVQVQLNHLEQAQQEVQRLQPLAAEQTTLEAQQTTLTQSLQQLEAVKLQQQQLAKQLRQRQADLTQRSQQIQQLESLAMSVEQIPQLEQQQERYQQQLSRLEAAQQFEAELRQMVVRGQEQRDRHLAQVKPALKLLEQLRQQQPQVEGAIVALQAGLSLNQELLSDLEQILADLAAQVSPEQLGKNLRGVQGQLNQAYQAQAAWATLPSHQAAQTQLQQEIEELQTRLEQFQTQLGQEASLRQQQTEVQTALQALNQPQAQLQLLQQQLRQQPQLQTRYQQAQRAFVKVEQAIATLDQQLTAFADLEVLVEQQRQRQQTHQAGYQTYLQHEKAAARLPDLQTQVATAIADLNRLSAQEQQLQTQLASLNQSFDPQRLETVSANYNQCKTQIDQLQGGLPPKRDQLHHLEEQLVIRQAIAEERDRALVDLARKRQIQQFVSDARKIYHQSGPRITRYYLQEISQEADRLFRELLNRPDASLEWTEDYEIRVQERGYKRSFKSLSGGEQMCAALAVRLALLKVLAAIDVAFFDEPTTNMDQPRRMQLAEALANLKTFRQLFVISHDDTFENVTENIIRVTREA